MTALRTLRLAHGYCKQETFANKCHVAESHLCALELGTKKPSEDLARTIAERLGEPVEKVFPYGFAERVKFYKQREDSGVGYTPEAKPRPVRYLDTCPKCGAPAVYHTCISCGKGLEAEEEAHA